MKKLFLTLVVAFATLCGFAQEIANTYWRNEATGDWLIGFAEKQVIYDSRFWDIKSMTEKRGGYTLTVENGSDVLDIKVGKMKNGARTIKVGDSRAVKCSPITTATLPDYPVKDNRVGFKDNGYRMGDSVTIVGWLKDMPAEALQRGGKWKMCILAILCDTMKSTF